MHLPLRNILPVFARAPVGSLVNTAFVMLSGSILPPPAGSDATTIEGLKASMHLFEPKHFIFPWLAHAIGTLVGAYLAALMGASGKLRLALIVGVLFMIGGIINVTMLPSPVWFSVLDIAGAYIPMAYLGWKFAARKK